MNCFLPLMQHSVMVPCLPLAWPLLALAVMWPYKCSCMLLSQTVMTMFVVLLLQCWVWCYVDNLRECTLWPLSSQPPTIPMSEEVPVWRWALQLPDREHPRPSCCNCCWKRRRMVSIMSGRQPVWVWDYSVNKSLPLRMKAPSLLPLLQLARHPHHHRPPLHLHRLVMEGWQQPESVSSPWLLRSEKNHWLNGEP